MATREGGRSQGSWVVWCLLVLVIVAAAVLVSTPRRSAPILEFASGITASSPAEQRLAAIDQQSPVIRTGSDAPYRRSLDVLSQRCTEERSTIGDLAIATRATLRSEARAEVTVLQVLQGAARAIPAGLPRTSCADVFDVLASSVVRQP